MYSMFDLMKRYGYQIAFPTTLAIDCSEVKDFEVTPILVSNKNAWLEKQSTNFIDGDFVYDPKAGEVKGEYPVFVTLSRKVGTREQRIIISGDSDVISNEGLVSSYPGIKSLNYNLVLGSFRWLSYGEYPVDTKRPEDVDLKIVLPKGSGIWINYFCMGIFPLCIAIGGIFTIIRRQRK